MVIFNSYVKLPEGTVCYSTHLPTAYAQSSQSTMTPWALVLGHQDSCLRCFMLFPSAFDQGLAVSSARTGGFQLWARTFEPLFFAQIPINATTESTEIAWDRCSAFPASMIGSSCPTAVLFCHQGAAWEVLLVNGFELAILGWQWGSWPPAVPSLLVPLVPLRMPCVPWVLTARGTHPAGNICKGMVVTVAPC